IVLFFVLFGWWRFDASLENDVGALIREQQFVGEICDEVDVRSDKVKYTICVDGIDGKVLVNSSRYPVYECGDRVFVKGEVEVPEAIEDFDYDKYLQRYEIYGVVYRGNVVLREEGSGLLKWVYFGKQKFETRLFDVFPEPTGSFLAGLLLGSRRGIPPQLMEQFNATGLTHIIAISGYNITLVIVLVGAMFKVFSRRIRVIFSSVFVVLFVFLVGASAAVVRAGIMGIISLMALYFGRNYFVWIALFASAFFMNLWNPKILVYDVGFQLSFLATAGIITFVPVFEKWFKGIGEFFGVKEALIMTLSAQIFTLPVIVWNFSRFAWISPLSNVLVLPLIPWAMLFGFFGVIFGKSLGVFAYIILKIVVLIVDFLAWLSG
ncbi:hypothetical protein HN709_03645, partial [Candidatus Peregrinibacteria bacterium]|nr:hypothetical protein [Candidatus Peregrinibacteria bacterium]